MEKKDIVMIADRWVEKDIGILLPSLKGELAEMRKELFKDYFEFLSELLESKDDKNS